MRTTQKQFQHNYECKCGAMGGTVTQEFFTHKEMKAIGAHKLSNDRYLLSTKMDSCWDCDPTMSDEFDND